MSHPRRKGRMKKLLTLTRIRLTVVVVVVVVVVVASGAEGSPNPLHPTAKECDSDEDGVTCVLQPGHDEYHVDSFKWNTHKKMEIQAYGNKLKILAPLCPGDDKTMMVYNASQVITVPNPDGCSLKLLLVDCQGVAIEGSVNWLKMESSHADKIMLQKVSQIIMEDCRVKEMNLMVDGKLSTITKSHIEVVKRLEVHDHLEIKTSKLGRVNGLVCDSRKADFHNVGVGHISPGGFQVRKGIVTFVDGSIEDLDSQAIIVKDGASLKVRYSRIGTTAYNTLITEPNTTLELKGMTIGQNVNISYSISDATITLYPLAFLQPRPMPPITWIVISMLFGLGVGSAIAVGSMTYLRKRRGVASTTNTDTNELLTKEHPAAAAKIETSPSSNTLALQVFPTPPARPLPKVPNEVNDEDTYTDTMPEPPSLDTPLTRVAQQPPLAPTKRSYSVKERAVAKFMPRLPHPKRNDVTLPATNDDRHGLPPPPPPAAVEDLYDQVEDLVSLGPPLPPANNKPKSPITMKPKPPPPPVRSKPNKP